MLHQQVLERESPAGIVAKNTNRRPSPNDHVNTRVAWHLQRKYSLACFKAVYGIEAMLEQEISEHKIAGTPFEPIASILKDVEGIETDGTFASVMRPLCLNADQVRQLVCFDKMESITGTALATRLRKFS